MEDSQLIRAEQVGEVMARHLLTAGIDVVVDFEKSQGAQLYDCKSNQYFLDFFSFYATNPLGFNHPRMTGGPLVRELGRVALHKPSNSDVHCREVAGFIRTFDSIAAPGFMKSLFLIEGGALAVENALKAAFDWKVRKNLARGTKTERGYKVIHFQDAFHGRSGYTLSLTNTFDLQKTQYFPKFDWPRVVNPKCTFPMEGENLERTIQLEGQALSQIRTTVEQESENIACIILEPIQGEGGDNHFRPEFHEELRRICDENEILLIYDEVQTGFGATGPMWAFEHFVKPDLLAFGKKFQVCGFMAGERIDEVPENVFRLPGRINSTWGGNIVDMVRCQFFLEICQEENLLERSRRLGELLLRELLDLQKEFPALVSNARGRGLFCAFDLPAPVLRDGFREKLFEHLLIMLPSGERSMRFRTSLTITEEELLEGIRRIREVLYEMSGESPEAEQSCLPDSRDKA